jgi:hypothetical protein
MSYLFPVVAPVQEVEESTLFQERLGRHPSRYRVNFTLPRLPIQSLYFDEMPSLTRSPPREGEPCTTLALDHATSCPFPNVPRRRVPCFISTLGAPAPVTSSMIKVCEHCIARLPDIDPAHPNDSYAAFQEPVATTWTPIHAIERPTYFTLPPPECTRSHDVQCAHNHCPDATHCTCNAQPSAIVEPFTCPHSHCATPSNCTCTQACPDVTAHVIAVNEPHPNCLVAHCPDITAHTNPNPDGTPVPSRCPDPAAHLPQPPRPSLQTVALSFWMDTIMSSFCRSPHSYTFATSLNPLINYIRSHEPLTRTEVAALDLTVTFPRLDHANQNAFAVAILATHSIEVVNNTADHATHHCSLLNCPLAVMAELRSGSRTLGSTSIHQLHEMMRARLSSAIA